MSRKDVLAQENDPFLKTKWAVRVDQLEEEIKWLRGVVADKDNQEVYRKSLPGTGNRGLAFDLQENMGSTFNTKANL